MDYQLEVRDDPKFQNLAFAICPKLLGIGMISFASGKDGGKDGKFNVIATNYSSAADS